MVSKDLSDPTTRRRMLKATGTAAGVSSLIGINVQAQSGGSESEQIVYARCGDAVVETKQVPKKWLDDVSRARFAAGELKKDYAHNNDIVSIGIGTRDESVGGLRMKSIIVRHYGESPKSDLPDQKHGVPIKTRTTSGGVKWDCYKKDYDPVRGGIHCTGTRDTSVNATLTCRVEYNSTYYLLHARHVFMPNGDGCDTGDPTGDPVYQNGDYIGEVADHHHNHEIVLIEFDDVNGYRDSTSSWIVDQDGVICGHLSKNGLDYIMSNNQSLRGRGVNSCQMSNNIQSYDETLCDACSSVCFNDLVYIDPDPPQGGDSGAPFYRYNSGDNEIYMSHLHSGRVDDDEHGYVAWGAAAYAINNNYGYKFGTGSDYQCG